jgi:hypothetical protein
MEDFEMANENGIVDKVGNVLQNKLLLQYLSGIGNSMAEGKGIAPGANTVTQQNISAQNMMNMMRQLLGPDGSKAIFSNTGMNLTVPPDQVNNLFGSALGNSLGTDKRVGYSPELTTPAQPPSATPTQVPVQGGGSSVANPFDGSGNSGLNFSASALAGLSTQDIATALGMQMKQKEAIADRPYKDLLVDNLRSEISAREPKFEIPGVGKVNATQYLTWEKLNKENKPNEVKLYEYAVGQGFKGSFMDFKESATTHKKDYSEAVKGGYKGTFNNWLLEQAKAGRSIISLDAKLGEKKAMSELEGQLYFNDPKWVDDINKLAADFDKNQSWLIPEKDRPLAKARIVVKGVKDKIEGGGGIIQDAIQSGSTMTWTVKWPSGDIKKIKQSIK